MRSSFNQLPLQVQKHILECHSSNVNIPTYIATKLSSGILSYLHQGTLKRVEIYKCSSCHKDVLVPLKEFEMDE